MEFKKRLYISTIITPALLLGACADDYLFNEEITVGSDAISFEAYASAGEDQGVTRSGEKPLYDPLVLGDGQGENLYLHTYVTDNIGSLPGDESEQVMTRGNQISTSADLIRYHGDYKVLATVDNGKNYFGWVNARNNSSDKNVWITDRVEYWPGDKVVDFYAVSPASEFSRLNELLINSGRMTFKYTLPSSGNNRDAEAQQDLLLTSSTCNKSGSVNGRAPLTFSHALAAVKFAVRDVANGEIENIRISGVRTQGECRYVYDGLVGKGTVSWSSLEGNGEFSQDFNYKISGLGAVDSADENADILLNSSMPEKTFMMIPQEISSDAEIIVTVKRTGMTPERIELRGKIRANQISEWKAGHEYVYTISTSKSNWIYVLEAYGNRNSSTGEYGVTKGDQIYAYSPSAVILDAGGRVQSYPHDIYGNNASFYVRSFRYHANDPAKREILSWKATHGEGKQYRVVSSNREEYVSGHDLTAAEWIPTRSALAGSGSFAAEGEKKTLTFATHHQLTDWPGDTWMQSQNAYPGNSETNPWDLSKAGGNLSRNTANAYIIDREGWYCFPLVYGNAIKNGGTNAKAYQYQGTTNGYNKNMVNYSGSAITGPWISVNDSYKADIVWSDVYNTLSDVQIRTINGEKMIVFQANRFNMQQGSVVIALYNGSSAIWSWHIWITEHWLDHTTGQSNAFKSNGKFASYEESSSGWRQRGDILINNSYVGSSYGYYISPYNLGWCDPKNVDYLRRPSTMTFTQYDASGKATGKTATLKILQDGERVEYKYGNNTYYQWGRKDPIVGFVDHSQTVKRNFGPKKYALTEKPSGIDIETAIKNPHVFYYGGEDWLTSSLYNLWNNSTSATKGIKTVYDPCPPGYMVPPAKMFEFIGPDDNGSFTNMDSNNSMLSRFNGTKVDNYTFKACVGNKNSQTNQNSVWLTSTGNRWWTNGSLLNGTIFNGGDNFNTQIVYLWSSGSRTGSSDKVKSNGLALGLDKFNSNGDNEYVICSYFVGRKTMARPVRAIREQ